MAKIVVHQDLKSLFGEEDLLEKSQNTSFTAMIFEMLSERAPTEDELKIFELILNLSIDHGPDTPSAVEVIKSAKDGKSMSESLAKGILEINEHHGGAGEGLMEILYKVQSSKLKVKSLVEKHVQEEKKLPGFGHRIYKQSLILADARIKQSLILADARIKQSLTSSDVKDFDPRAELVFDKLSVLGMGEEFIKIVREIQVEFEEQTGKHLPINIDGAIAVALCSFDFDPKLGVAVFLIARTPGLLAHYLNNS